MGTPGRTACWVRSWSAARGRVRSADALLRFADSPDVRVVWQMSDVVERFEQDQNDEEEDEGSKLGHVPHVVALMLRPSLYVAPPRPAAIP